VVKSIGYSGFASDGAWHVSPDANNNAKITWDRTRYRPGVVIHDWPFLSGSTPDEHLVGHWKCNDNAASTVIVDETGSYNGTLESRDNTEDLSNADAVRGTSLLLNGTDEIINISSAIAGLTTTDELAILIKMKPNFAYDVADSQGLFSLYSDEANTLNFQYYSNTDKWRLFSDIDAGNSNLYSGTAYTGNNDLQQWHTLLIVVNVTNGVAGFVFDGEVVGQMAFTAWNEAPTTMKIGYEREGGTEGAFYIDEVKLLDGAILPYGAYFTGNGSVDSAVAHKDITFYWDCDISAGSPYAANIAGGSSVITINGTATDQAGVVGRGIQQLGDVGFQRFEIPISGNFSISEGAISLWYKYTGAQGFGGVCWTDVSNAFLISVQTDLTVITIGNDHAYLNMTGIKAATEDGNWHHFLWWWSESKSLRGCRFDGKLVEEESNPFSTSGYSPTELRVGASSDWSCSDGIIDEFYISSNPYTPQIWTAFGKPLWMPLLEVA